MNDMNECDFTTCFQQIITLSFAVTKLNWITLRIKASYVTVSTDR